MTASAPFKEKAWIPLTVLVLGLAIFLYACIDPGPTVSEESIALADSLWPPAPPPLPPSPGRNVAVRLFVDGSQSMQGFVGGTAPAKYGEVLDKITFNVGLDSLYRFGQFPGGFFQPVPASSAMKQATFYTATHNPDQVLFSRLLADTSATASFLYVTDGVLSDQKGLTQASVITQLKQHLASGGGLGILAFRSQFKGRAWSEQRQQWVGEADVPDRPFYVFLIAPDQAAYQVLRTKLGALVLDADAYYHLDSGAVECGPELVPGVPLEEASREHRWMSLRLSDVNPGSQTQLVEFKCTAQKTFPLTGFTAKLQSKVFAWNSDSARFEPAAGWQMQTMQNVENVTPDESSVKVTTQITSPGSRYSFIFIQPVEILGRLRPEVERLTTSSDADPALFNRTYGIGYIIEALAREQLQQALTVKPLFLTIDHAKS